MKKHHLAGLAIFIAGILLGVALTRIGSSSSPSEKPAPAEKLESPGVVELEAVAELSAEDPAPAPEPDPGAEEIGYYDLSEEEAEIFEDNVLSLVARAKAGDPNAFVQVFKELGITRRRPGYDVFWAERLYDEIKAANADLTFPNEPEVHQRIKSQIVMAGEPVIKLSMYLADKRDYRAAKAAFKLLIEKKDLSPGQEAVLWKGVEVADAYFQLKSKKERSHRNDWIVAPEREKYLKYLTKVAEGFVPTFDRKPELARHDVRAMHATYKFGFDYDDYDHYVEKLVEVPLCQKAWEKHRLYFANSCMVLSGRTSPSWSQWVDEERIQEIKDNPAFRSVDGFAILPFGL